MTDAVTTPIPATKQWSLFGINSDQWFSLGTSLLAFVGTVLAAHGVGSDVINVATGVLAVVIATGLSIWQNLGSWPDIAAAAVRKLLLVIGAFAVARGWLTNEQVAEYSGIAMTGLTMLWSMLHYSSAAGPNLVGTTILDATPAVTSGGTPVPKPA